MLDKCLAAPRVPPNPSARIELKQAVFCSHTSSIKMRNAALHYGLAGKEMIA